MSCMTCHDTHKKERENYALFNNRCKNCHNSNRANHVKCSVARSVKEMKDNNCVQCHMPLTPSKLMQVETSQDLLKPVNVRTHFIGVYQNSLSNETTKN